MDQRYNTRHFSSNGVKFVYETLQKDIDCLDLFNADGASRLWCDQRNNHLNIHVNTWPRANKPGTPETLCNDTSNVRMTYSSLDPLEVLGKKQYDFIHVSTVGTPVRFFDAVFHSIRNRGLISVDCEHLGPLLAKNAGGAMRVYGAVSGKTDYNRELAVRILLASMVRSAARHDRAIQPLLTCMLSGHVVCICQVIRKSSEAAKCVDNIRQILHCMVCSERCFIPNSEFPRDENPFLPCTCVRSSNVKSSKFYGPAWSGRLLSLPYISFCIQAANDCDRPLLGLYNMLKVEAVCPLTMESHEALVKSEKLISKPDDEPCIKKSRLEASVGTEVEQAPSFYYLRQSFQQGGSIPKLDKFVEMLRRAGYRASRTHFDLSAVKTSASLSQMRTVLIDNGFGASKEKP